MPEERCRVGYGESCTTSESIVASSPSPAASSYRHDYLLDTKLGILLIDLNVDRHDISVVITAARPLGEPKVETQVVMLQVRSRIRFSVTTTHASRVAQVIYCTCNDHQRLPPSPECSFALRLAPPRAGCRWGSC